MFPTWPAKSVQDCRILRTNSRRGLLEGSPRATSGGHAFKKIQGDDDEEREGNDFKYKFIGDQICTYIHIHIVIVQYTQ